MAFSYYTFLHKFRWEQLEFSEIPAKLSEGAPEVPRVYGHYKQPELPPPKQKENPKLQRAATTMRARVNTACCDVIALAMPAAGHEAEEDHATLVVELRQLPSVAVEKKDRRIFFNWVETTSNLGKHVQLKLA